jgi:hypothetical protein
VGASSPALPLDPCPDVRYQKGNFPSNVMLEVRDGRRAVAVRALAHAGSLEAAHMDRRAAWQLSERTGAPRCAARAVGTKNGAQAKSDLDRVWPGAMKSPLKCLKAAARGSDAPDVAPLESPAPLESRLDAGSSHDYAPL